MFRKKGNGFVVLNQLFYNPINSVEMLLGRERKLNLDVLHYKGTIAILNTLTCNDCNI